MIPAGRVRARRESSCRSSGARRHANCGPRSRWADWYSSEGDGWYAWLLPGLPKTWTFCRVSLYTAVSRHGAEVFFAAADTETYADFIDVMITRLASYFEWIELWNRPNDPTSGIRGSTPIGGSSAK